MIPAALSFEVAEILTRRRCPPPVLAHPALRTHRVIIAGERFPVPLGWIRPPQPDALRLCRETDVAAALRAALRAAPPTPPPTPRGHER